MKIENILQICAQIKAEGIKVTTNYYNKYNNKEVEFDIIQGEGTIVFGVQEEYVYRIFFVSNNMKMLLSCLKEVKKNAVIDYVCRGDMGEVAEIIENSGWRKCYEYERITTKAPEVIKDKTRTRKLLERMYDPNCGELATEKDIPQIQELMWKVFDPIGSEIMTDAELREAINNETVWVYKSDEKICTLYIYRIEGRKRYGAITYNCLSANYLFNILQRANGISDKKDKPVIHYYWIRVDNQRIRHSMIEENSYCPDGMKNYIYVKN